MMAFTSLLLKLTLIGAATCTLAIPQNSNIDGTNIVADNIKVDQLELSGAAVRAIGNGDPLRITISGEDIDFTVAFDNRDILLGIGRLEDAAQRAGLPVATVGGYIRQLLSWINLQEAFGQGQWNGTLANWIRLMLQRPPYGFPNCARAPGTGRELVGANQTEEEVDRSDPESSDEIVEPVSRSAAQCGLSTTRRCRRPVSARQCRISLRGCRTGMNHTWWHHCSRCANICSAKYFSAEEVAYNGYDSEGAAVHCAWWAMTHGRKNPVEQC